MWSSQVWETYTRGRYKRPLIADARPRASRVAHGTPNWQLPKDWHLYSSSAPHDWSLGCQTTYVAPVRAICHLDGTLFILCVGYHVYWIAIVDPSYDLSACWNPAWWAWIAKNIVRDSVHFYVILWFLSFTDLVIIRISRVRIYPYNYFFSKTIIAIALYVIPDDI